MGLWQSGLNNKKSTQSIEKLLFWDQLSTVFVELPEEFGPPEARQSEEEKKVLEWEKTLVIAEGQIIIDQF